MHVLIPASKAEVLRRRAVFPWRKVSERTLEGLADGDESFAGAPLDAHGVLPTTYRMGCVS